MKKGGQLYRSIVASLEQKQRGEMKGGQTNENSNLRAVGSITVNDGVTSKSGNSNTNGDSNSNSSDINSNSGRSGDSSGNSRLFKRIKLRQCRR